MPLTPDQLAALAQTGAMNREIAAALGRPMNPAERAIVDRARVVWRLKREQKRGVKKLDSAGRNKKLRDEAHILAIPDLTPEQRRERARLEKDTPKWLRHFFLGIYRQPFGAVHHEIIIKTDASCKYLARRCIGKTQELLTLPLSFQLDVFILQ